MRIPLAMKQSVANCFFTPIKPRGFGGGNTPEIKQDEMALCGEYVVRSGLSPAFAQETPITQGIHAQQRDAFVSNLMKQMTLEEKIGQLRLISVEYG